ncbi:hypothetical protein K144316041_p21660 (plasmid) [Clostridium tetani]|uniref:hypothetical protein n=1 Tax=Clostridium tetani TaxID=1513 RepID=UPI002955DC84|nr:hypothetical protein [Clostridium tetani]BDR74327.1 hypothetical protein K144316041_p21660 [Clostridium tetani]
MNNNKFEVFEGLIQTYLCDPDSTIKDCQLKENDLGVYLLVNYTITDKYAKENDLDYKNRTMEILLKRKNSEGAPISSYAIPEV